MLLEVVLHVSPSTSKQGHHDLQGNNNANDLQTSNKITKSCYIYMLLLVNKWKNFKLMAK